MQSPSSSIADTGYSDRSQIGSRPKKRKRSTGDADDDDVSHASSSIGWNPQWDDDDSIKKESSELPLSSIDVAVNEPVENVKAEPADEHEHQLLSTREHQDDSSSSSERSYATLMQSQLTVDNETIVRYQMLGAPVLVYRHAPSYVDKSTWPSPLTPSQIEMAEYFKNNPISSWFKKDQNKSANKGETYPQSIQRFLPKQKRLDIKNSPIDALHTDNRARIREAYRLPMQSSTYLSKKEKQQLLENERLKWLEWKICRWESKDRYRKYKAWRLNALHEYRMQCDVKRLAHCWEREDETEEVKRERRRQRRLAKRQIRVDGQTDAGDYTWEPRGSQLDANNEKLSGLEFLGQDSPVVDHSSSISSASSLSDSSFSSIESYSTSSISTHYSDESAFYQWEEETLVELSGVPDSLSNLVFDGDPSKDSGNDQSINDKSHTSHYHYTLNDLVQILEQNCGKKEALIGDLDAPFHRHDVEDEFIQSNKIGGASSYGNCLVVLRCTCPSCHVNNNKQSALVRKKQLPTFYLVHPTGEGLSSVAVSKIRLPRDLSSACDSDNTIVDMNSRILQISVCGKSASTTLQEICLVARTSSHCSALIARPKAVKCSSSGAYECPTAFELSESARIDLRSSRHTNQPSYLPSYVTCDPKMCISFFTNPSFAILCLGEDGCRTYIHHVKLREQSQMKGHNFSSELSEISIIEFDPRDRMVLWAAARPKEMPAVTERYYNRRGGNADREIVEGLAGYGHSLYKIDLRSNTATFIWSPSHAEYTVDGVYSINGILPDAYRDHILWINSSSAGKTWALDVRYKKPKVLVSWSLPSLCDGLGTHCSITGVHGAGVLMNQTVSCLSSTDSLPTMFTTKKDPNTSTLNAYQFPSSMPRFQTRSLESSGFIEASKSQYNTTSIARSTTFVLPDISESIFGVGMALLEMPSLTSLSGKKLDTLGYKTMPARSVYAFTMTNTGDIYCHVLLACDATEEPKARPFPGLPIGSTSIPVPKLKEHKIKVLEHSDGEMTVQLRNVFPIPSSAVEVPFLVGCNEAVDFKSFDINEFGDKSFGGDGSPQTKNSESAFRNRFPCPFGDLGQREFENEDFDTLLLMDNKKPKSEIYASINQDDLNRQVEVHPDAGFGFSSTKDAPPVNRLVPENSKDVKLSIKHVLVALPKDKDETTTSRDVHVGDLAPNLLQMLNDEYFKSSAAREPDANLFAVKEEPYSDDNDSIE